MEIIKKIIAKEDVKEEMKISVIQFDDYTFEMAILYKDLLTDQWELDYSIFNDVIKADTEMEVYGIIQYEIAPAYYEKYNVDFSI